MEKLVRVVLRGKTVVQQYCVKTLNGNRNVLKQKQMLSVIAAQLFYYFIIIIIVIVI